VDPTGRRPLVRRPNPRPGEVCRICRGYSRAGWPAFSFLHRIRRPAADYSLAPGRRYSRRPRLRSSFATRRGPAIAHQAVLSEPRGHPVAVFFRGCGLKCNDPAKRERDNKSASGLSNIEVDLSDPRRRSADKPPQCLPRSQSPKKSTLDIET
jgi:hypothetical protein